MMVLKDSRNFASHCNYSFSLNIFKFIRLNIINDITYFGPIYGY